MKLGIDFGTTRVVVAAVDRGNYPVLSFEFGHSQKLKGRLLVYDLGGGTFDASLVDLDERTHTVVASEGIATLGGDDFDHLLAEMALEKFVPGRWPPPTARSGARGSESPLGGTPRWSGSADSPWHWPGPQA